MLQELHIENFNIIEKAQVEFQEGFHVLSGETGAGKSFLVQALSFALGSRSDADQIREGAEEATVTAVFKVPDREGLREELKTLGLELSEEDPHLYFRRQLNRKNRSRAFLNDKTISLKVLQQLGDCLVHRVGQNAAQQILEEGFLIQLLDQYGSHQKQLAEYRSALGEYQEAKEACRRLRERVTQAREQEDFLRFQFQELTNARLREGEEEELEKVKSRLKHRVTLAQHAFELTQNLWEGDDAVVDRLGQAQGICEKARALDPALEKVSRAVREARENLEEVGSFLQGYTQELEAEPESLDEIENRLVQIQDLKKKFRLEVRGLLEKLKQLEIQLSEIEDFEGTLNEKNQNLEAAQKKLLKIAESLHNGRVKAGESISAELQKNLKDLALPHALIRWEVEMMEALEDFRHDGPNRLTLWISFNPGIPPRPFQEVISGGELSRLLLAIFEVLYPPSLFGTFVFDEVDAGVSGSVAELIGKKLARLSRQSQVLCITHLPQIAGQATWQYVVEKEIKKGRTFSGIRRLKEDERIQEIARMLAGVKVTDQALKHAREMLKNSAA